MRVSEAMTRDVRLCSPDHTIREAASAMAEIDSGILPVADGDRLVGMVTDRDIAIRAVAAGKGPETAVRDVMTEDVRYCYEDEDTDEIARNMGEQQVRRMPVMNRDKRLVGIVSIGDMALMEGARPAGEALAGISEPGGKHTQSGGARH